MTAPGSLRIVGLGPAGADWLTPEALEWIASASDLIGYEPYLDRLPAREGQARHASGNGAEMERARHALQLARSGRHAAIVSGGDPGIFAMAAAVFEAVDKGEPGWRNLDILVSPGISAMQAAAARAGAPLGHDFCAISLSDNLKPWPLVERRLAAAAEADFVIAIDQALKARLDRLSDALAAQKANEAKASAGGQGPGGGSLQRGGLGNALSLAFRVLSEFVAAVLVGTGLGFGLDRLLGTSPIFLIVFLLMGAAAGFWNVYRIGTEKPGKNRE